MAIEAAKLMVVIGADGAMEVTQQLGLMGQSVKGTAAESEVLAGGMSNLNGSMGDVMTGLTGVSLETMGLTAVVAGAVAGFKWMVDAAGEAEQAQAKLGAVLKSTNGAVGMSKLELNNLAETLSATSGTEKDLVTNSEAVMLTFREIGHNIFPQAMDAAMNMSAVMGQDLQSSVVQLGKALNDPITGLTALKRVGVSFTESQVALIKSLQESGDTMGAQKVILGELDAEFGGAATAMGNTMPGAIGKMNNSFRELGETIGTAMTPAIMGMTNILMSAANSANLMLSWNDRINTATKSTSDSLVKTTKSYGEYKDKLIEVGISSGKLSDDYRTQTQVGGDLAANQEKMIVNLGGMTEAQWEGNRAAQTAIDTYGKTPDTGWLGLITDQAAHAADGMQKLIDKYDAQSGDVKLLDSAYKEHVITLEQYGAELAKAADGSLVMGKVERESMAVEIDKALITDKLNKAMEEHAKQLEAVTTAGRKTAGAEFDLAESLMKASAAAEKKIAFDNLKKTLDDSGVTGEKYTQIMDNVGLKLGLVSQKSIDMAAGQTKLNLAVAQGAINTDQYNKGIDMLTNGQIVGATGTDAYLAIWGKTPAVLTPATTAVVDVGTKMDATKLKGQALSTDVATQFGLISTNIGAAGIKIGSSFDKIGLDADGVTGKIGNILQKTKDLQDWASQNEINITVRVNQIGGTSYSPGSNATSSKNPGNSISGGINIGTGAALGADVSAGEIYKVNERGGPVEYFRPNVDGEVIPLGASTPSTGSGNVYNLYFTATHVGEDDVLRALGKAEYLYG